MNERQDVIDYLVEEGGYRRKEAEAMSNRELFDAWLEWQGIIGYSEYILEVLSSLGFIKEETIE